MIDSKQDEAVKLEAKHRLVHMSHCNQGEYIGSCKYGEDEACPALTRDPDKQEALAGEGVEYPADAIDQLVYHQTQLDPDGCMVGVSRQAIDEVIAYVHCALSRTPSSPQADEADVERVAKAIATKGFGRAWGDFLPCNAFDTDQNDLLAYATAALSTMTTRPAGGEEVEPSSGDDGETRAFIAGWNARRGEHAGDFDMALHWWKREQCGLGDGLALTKPAALPKQLNTDEATADQVERASAAVAANLENGTPKHGSAQGYACALTAIMQTDAALPKEGEGAIRARAFEEAARVAENAAIRRGMDGGTVAAMAAARIDIAATIRALSSLLVRSGEARWDDAKFAFGVEDGESLNSALDGGATPPPGWRLNETTFAGAAGLVAIFRFESLEADRYGNRDPAVPTRADVDAIIHWLGGIGAEPSALAALAPPPQAQVE